MLNSPCLAFVMYTPLGQGLRPGISHKTVPSAVCIHPTTSRPRPALPSSTPTWPNFNHKPWGLRTLIWEPCCLTHSFSHVPRRSFPTFTVPAGPVHRHSLYQLTGSPSKWAPPAGPRKPPMLGHQ